jgi:hypothetical protein
MAVDGDSQSELVVDVRELQAQVAAGAELIAAARVRSDADATTIRALNDSRDEWRARAAELRAEVASLRQALGQEPENATSYDGSLEAPSDGRDDSQLEPEVAVPAVLVVVEPAVEPAALPGELSAAVDRVGIFTTLAEVAVDSEGDPAAEAIAAYGFDPQDTASNVTPVEVLPQDAPAPRGRLARLRS